ncbi:hypothetical protein WOLCODRAFT_28164 [Wolfiporia cocos MD-104 SS10]|uniref:Uncharacterized protein n=1 Tax=Wolfiporia cocos (strain MD-104) TaxID=742152 RepID=A0A2H3J0S6_WOLCO|nr:hypothetical protein WOLCODRAFT_28164 [Wolfiporia cocos MD-104 SS10]
MSAVSDDQSMATAVQTQTLTNQWNAVSNDANAYIKALTDTTFLVKDFAALRSQFETFKKVPVTKHELAVYKLAVAAGIIGNVGVEKAISQYVAANDQISAAANVSDEDAKIVKGVLGPPTDAKEQLDDLADRTGKIIDQFNTLLQQPYLDQFACTDPLDGSQTNIFTMVTGFKQEYVALQQKTLPVARDLQAYAELQIALLPIVVTKDPKPGNLTLEDFIATNKPLVDDYLVKASELSAESTAIQKKWDNAIAVVQKAINECTSNIEKWQASVDQLSEELKKVKLYAALAAAGAFIAFTAAVFLPGIGMLAALGVGGVLGALSIKEAIDASKLIQAINELKSAIKNEEATRAKLESLLPYMTNIAKSLSQVSQIWSDIATALTTLNNFYAVLGGPTGSIILDTLRPTIIESWKTVSASVKAYIDAVAK